MIYLFVKRFNRVLWATLLVVMFSLLSGWNSTADAQDAELTTAVLPFAVTGQETGLIKELMSRVKGSSRNKPDTMGEEFALLLMRELSETHLLGIRPAGASSCTRGAPPLRPHLALPAAM